MWAWNVMRADVIVNCTLVQLEPIKCLELVVCSHQMSECLFGFFTDWRWEIQVDDGKHVHKFIQFQNGYGAAVTWGEGQLLLTFSQAFVSCLCAFIRCVLLLFVWVWAYQTVMGGGGRSVEREWKRVLKKTLCQSVTGSECLFFHFLTKALQVIFTHP